MLSLRARVYIVAVAVVGLIAIFHSLTHLPPRPLDSRWFLLLGLTVFSGFFTIKVPSVPIRLSVSETFVFASVLLFGPATATVIVSLDSLVASLWSYHRRPSGRRAHRILFNVTCPAFSIWAAGHLFLLVAPSGPLSKAPTTSFIAPLLLLTVAYFLLHNALLALAVALETTWESAQPFLTNFPWLSLSYFAGASAAVLLVPYYDNLFNVTSIIVPLLAISYLTLKAAMGRAEDATQHISQLNNLYLSTIETLAMAIDAKDQITHGHIRRVQQSAVDLARHLGVRDTQLIHAIEAAALLHDMGKLAVPEYILNKPGTLTPAEFERMKLHASVGADILSAINFPYPVVPIVRHHHENWDGTGYPSGLRGTDIPIGARILSVVDCFDALTSDRPYRPKLSMSAALQIVNDRRGTMYDPLIVDTFFELQKRSTRPFSEGGTASDAFAAIADASHLSHADARPFDNISATSDESSTLYGMEQALRNAATVDDAFDIVSGYLKRMIPSTLNVLYLNDVSRAELTAAAANGPGAARLLGVRMSLGQRVSGWVAANSRTIINSDAVLDLGDIARSTKPRLRTCLSTPILSGDRLLAVLTLYSDGDKVFTDDYSRIAEAAAGRMAQWLDTHPKSTSDLSSETNDGIPQTLDSVTGEPEALNEPYAIIVARLGSIDGARDVAPQVVARVCGVLQGLFPEVDVCVQRRRHECLVAWTPLELRSPAGLLQRAMAALRTVRASEARTAIVRVSIGLAICPDDGESWQKVVQVARGRAQSNDSSVSVSGSEQSIH